MLTKCLSVALGAAIAVLDVAERAAYRLADRYGALGVDLDGSALCSDCATVEGCFRSGYCPLRVETLGRRDQ